MAKLERFLQILSKKFLFLRKVGDAKDSFSLFGSFFFF